MKIRSRKKVLPRRRTHPFNCGGEGGKPGPCPEGGAAKVSPRRRREQAALDREMAAEIADDNRIHGDGKHTLVRPAGGAFDHPGRHFAEGAIEDVLRPRTALAVSYFPRDGVTVFHSGKGKDVWLSSTSDGGINLSVGGMNRSRTIPPGASREEIVARVSDLIGLKPRGNAAAIVNAKKRKRAVSPLRADPSRTAGIRRRFGAELRRRFARLKAKLVRLVVEQDAFGLLPRPPLNPFAVNEDWKYHSSPEQVRRFEEWLRQQIRADLTGVSDEQVWERFVREGFERGAGRAFDDTRRTEKALADTPQKLDFYAGTRDEFLRSAFGQPVAVEKVKLLAGRTFSELEGVTETMSTAITRSLVDGMVQGQNPREIARTMTRQIDISRSRAETIAQTETIRSHAEGQLQALEQMGVEEVGVMVEWSTAGDGRVCAKCRAMEGVVLKLDEAKGKIPLHPRCRCSFMPAQVGEDTAGQKKTKASLDVSKDRPESILDRKG